VKEKIRLLGSSGKAKEIMDIIVKGEYVINKKFVEREIVE